MSLTTFSPSTLIKSAEMNTNLSGLSDGSFDAIANSLQQFRDESLFDFVVSGLVWSGDAYASTKAASMTSGIVMINGRRILISAVTAHTFTASKDTYSDILDNADGTGTLVYTEVTNNAASPALASNSIRIGIIVTGATNIAAAGSVNQGQVASILPIASSIAYSVTDSLGNIICNRNPNPGLLGYRQIVANFTTASLTQVDVTGLNATVLVPSGRRLEIVGYASNVSSSAVAASIMRFTLYEDGVQIETDVNVLQVSGGVGFMVIAYRNPSSGSHVYKLEVSDDSAGTTTVSASATAPAYIAVKVI